MYKLDPLKKERKREVYIISTEDYHHICREKSLNNDRILSTTNQSDNIMRKESPSKKQLIYIKAINYIYIYIFDLGISLIRMEKKKAQLF